MNTIPDIIFNIAEKYFGLFCHQDPSVLVCNSQGCIPLCPRCMGLHIGFLTTMIVLLLRVKKPIKIVGSGSWVLLFSGILVLALEWTFARFSFTESSMLSRLMTGLAAGSNFGLLFYLYRSSRNRSDPSRCTVLKPLQIMVLISLSLAGSSIMSLFKYQLVVTVILLFTVCVNTIIIVHTVIIRLFQYLKIKSIPA